MINDEAISFTTLRRFQAQLADKDRQIAIKDRQIAFLVEALQATANHAQGVLQALQESNAPDQPN